MHLLPIAGRAVRVYALVACALVVPALCAPRAPARDGSGAGRAAGMNAETPGLVINTADPLSAMPGQGLFIGEPLAAPYRTR